LNLARRGPRSGRANGAGKSTLIRILAGVVTADAGTVRLEGEPVDVGDPHHAHSLGFAFLHQELNLIPKFDALANMSLGLVRRNAVGLADRGPAFERARVVAKDIGFDFPSAVLSQSSRSPSSGWLPWDAR